MRRAGASCLAGASLYLLHGLPIWIVSRVGGGELILGEWGLLSDDGTWTVGVVLFTVALAVATSVAGRRRTIASAAVVVLTATAAYLLPEAVQIVAAYGIRDAGAQLPLPLYLTVAVWLNLWVAGLCALVAVQFMSRAGPPGSARHPGRAHLRPRGGSAEGRGVTTSRTLP